MLPRFPAVTRSLSLAALLVAGPAAALELPLPPPGEDIVGQVHVIKAKYEDTFADIGTANDLGYLEMIAANPGVDPWLPGAGTEIILPTRYILPPGPPPNPDSQSGSSSPPPPPPPPPPISSREAMRRCVTAAHCLAISSRRMHRALLRRFCSSSRSSMASS